MAQPAPPRPRPGAAGGRPAQGKPGPADPEEARRQLLGRGATRAAARAALPVLRRAGIAPAPEEYGRIMLALSRLGMWPQARSLWLEARFRGVRAWAESVRIAAVAALREGAAGRAEGLFRQLLGVEAAEAADCNAVLSECRKAGDWARALRLFGELEAPGPGPGPDLASYNILLGACGDAGLPERAAGLLAGLRGRRLAADATSHLGAVRACAAAGLWARAAALLSGARAAGLEPGAAACASAARACGPAWDRALGLLAGATARAGPQALVCNAAVGACARARRWEAVLALLDAMRRADLAPDGVTYNAALDAHVQGGQLARARLLLSEMARERVARDVITYNTAAAIMPPKSVLDEMAKQGISPNVRTFNAMISACAEGGWPEALDLWAAMRGRRLAPDVFTFNRLIKACEGAQEGRLGLRLLGLMEAQGLAPDAVTQLAVLASCARAGRWQWAVRLLWAGRARGPPPGTAAYNAAISACAAAAQWDWALGLLGEMQRQRLAPDATSYNAAMSACGARPEWVSWLMDGMHRGEVPLDCWSYASAMDAFGSAGRWEGALELFSTMRRSMIEPNDPCYRTLIDSCGKAQQWQAALCGFTEMQQSRREPLPQGTLVQVLLLLISVGQQDAAEALLAEGFALGIFSRWQTGRAAVVDLHGMAPAVAKLATLMALRNQGAARAPRALIVITGRGLNSPDDPVLHPAVLSLLRTELDLNVRSEVGSLHVSAAEVSRFQAAFLDRRISELLDAAPADPRASTCAPDA